MVDLSAIAGAISALHGASQIAGGIVAARDENLLNQRAIELQNAILSAQSAALSAQSEQMLMAEELRALKEKLRDAEAWLIESQRYQLTEIDPGVCVYFVRAESRNGEPQHAICPSCFQAGRKAILFSKEPGMMSQRVACVNCRFEIKVHSSNEKFFRTSG